MRFTFGGGAEARTPVHNILSEKDYTFRSRFVIPSEISEFSHHSAMVVVLTGNHARFVLF
jgi:hypothetical protein